MIRINFSFILLFSFIILTNSCSMINPVIKEEHSTVFYSRQSKSIAKDIDNLLDKPFLKRSHIGIHIIDAETEQVLYSRDAHKLFMPASNMKIFTTASGLVLLGKDYKYKTELYINGNIEDGILKGDLYIKGYGDPSIAPRHYDGDLNYVFMEWVKVLKDHGIRVISGDLVGDVSLFGGKNLGGTWEIEDVPFYYSAKTGALSINDNCADICIVPGKKEGDSAIVFDKSGVDYLKIDNQVVTVHADSSSDIDFNTNQYTEDVFLDGQISVNSDTLIKYITIANPGKYLLESFKYTLEANDISCRSIRELQCVDSSMTNWQSLKMIYTHYSVPLEEIVYELNKSSNNFYAETLQKTLGLEINGKATTKDGINAEKEWFSRIGIKPEDIFIVDGSGLSRHNMVTPHQIVKVLQAMKVHETFNSFYNSLPIGGVDGTLKRRFKNNKEVGKNVHAKTGYVGHVRTLSGYVTAQNGREYIFSLMFNHYPAPTSLINDLQDTIVTRIYYFDE